MRTVAAVAISMFLALSSAARAATVSDLDAWAQSFTQAALKADDAGMLKLVGDVTEVNFDQTVVKDGMKKVRDFLGPHQASYAEQFTGEQLGTFARRINIAVIYPDQQLYYSIFFIRRSGGWAMTNLSFNNKLSEILKVSWPN